MNKTNLILPGIVFIFFLAYVGATTPNTPVMRKVPEVSVTGFIPDTKNAKVENSTYEAFRKSFMDGCDPEGQQYAYCSCAFNDLWENNTAEELSIMNMDITTDKAKTALAKSTVKCAGLYINK